MTSTKVSVSHTLERGSEWWDLAIPCTLTAGSPATYWEPGDPGEIEVHLDKMTVDGGTSTKPPELTAEEREAITNHCCDEAPDCVADREADRADYLAGLDEDRRRGL